MKISFSNLKSKKNTIYKIYHKLIKRDGVYENYSSLKDSEFLTKQELNELQLSNLRRIVRFSYENTSYYKILFDKIEFNPYSFDLKDFERIPFLTKTIINENFDEIKVKNNPRKYKIASTSGTTGRKFTFIKDLESSPIRQAHILRFYDWMNLNHNCTKMTIWGTSFNNVSKCNLRRIKYWFKNHYIFSGYNLSLNDIKYLITFIQKQRVQLIISYPSILDFMATEIKKNNLKISSNQLIIQTAGEKLFDHQRVNIADVFNAEIFDFYGAVDIPFIAHECEIHNGLHIAANNIYLEIINSSGDIVSNEEGEIVTTDLHNYVMPLIRYKIGDVGTLSSRSCKCGRSLPLLEKVGGRILEIIQFPNGNSVGGTFWPLLLKSENGIEKFQIIQKTKFNINIKYIPNEYLSQRVLDNYRKKIEEYGGEEVVVTFEEVSHIKPTSAGKFQYIISEWKK